MSRNTDFSKRAAVHAADEPWVASPMPGVDRRILDRIGDEVARATSIVRYAPGSAFSPHVHTGGEEFYVLDGVFSDEHGDFPTGSYIRNPPETSHTPSSEPGCTIFVKLWQFDLADRTQVRLNTNELNLEPVELGVDAALLHQDQWERVTLEHWAPGSNIPLKAPNGMEVLVLEGAFEESDEAFKKDSWLRLPKGSETIARVGSKGAKVWIKRDHLAKEPEAPSV